MSGILFTISAPSGAGKTSLVNQLLQQNSQLELSVSHTTRPQRANETDGVDYFFVTKDQFATMQKEQQFIEFAKVYDNYYGTSSAFVQEKLAQGKNLILEINWEGAQQIKKKLPDTIGIYILPPSLNALQSRLKKRNQDDSQTIEKRINEAKSEIQYYDNANYIVINESFETALNNLQAIIVAVSLQKQTVVKTLEFQQILSTFNK